jgi:hypothetical protein
VKRLWLGLLLLASGAEGAYFTVAQSQGVWWLVDPQGKKVFSRGVCGVSPGEALDRFDPAAPAYCALRFYPSADKWRQATQERLRFWGFNTLGAGADPVLTASGALPYTVGLSLGAAVGVPYADPSALAARTKIRELLAPLLKLNQDQRLIGYYLDSQLGWWDESVVLHILRQASAKDPLKEALMTLLDRAYGGDLRRFAEDFAVEPEPRAFVELRGALRKAAFRPGRRPQVVEEFLQELAERYYRTMAEEVREADPNHLLLGDRYAGWYSQPVARAAGKFVDVVSTTYDTCAPQGWASPFYFESLARLARKPILVSEIYYAAAENRSGDRNRHGPYMTVPTQEERAAGAAGLMTCLAKFPSVIGVHWFQYADQPPASDGEDFNMGLVDLKDAPYAALTEALTKAAPDTERDHGTWPAGAGLARAPQGLKVPAMGDLPIVNGSLDEWPLDRSWVPGVSAAAPFERFGDLYLCWRPEGLGVAVVYMDYRARPRALDGPETDTERLTIGAGIDNEKPVVFTLKGILERADPDRPEAGFRTPEVLAVRGGVPFPAEGRFLVAQGQHGMSRIVEVFLPAALFRRERLDPAEILRATVSLRLRANSKELFWPRPFKVSAWDASEDWVPLVLDVTGLTAETAPAPRPAPVPAVPAPVVAAPAPVTATVSAASVTAPAVPRPVTKKPAARPAAKPAAKPVAKPAAKPAR